MNAVATRLSRSHRHLAYAGLATALVALIVAVYTRESVGWWPVVAFGLAPDVPLLLGGGRGLERGQLHPRAVPFYNLVHRFWGPLLLGAVALAAGLPAAWLVGALSWATHVAVDRAVGYGLRAPMASNGLSPRAQEIVAAARALLDKEGVDALTMRGLADQLGIRAPSLYKHLPGKEALEAAVISGGFVELAQAFEKAVTDAEDQLGALAVAYRAFALERPHLYRLMTERPLRRDLLEPGVEERAARSLLEAAGGDEARARAAWAFAHGMTILELNGRFPPIADLDAAWREGLRGFRRVER